MDKSIIDDLAEEEVRIANDRWRIWGSLFKDLIAPKQKDLPSALKLYESLSDEQIERRYGIHYWEDAAWSVYDTLRYHSVDIFTKSIEPRRLAELETKNVDLLLKKGKFQLISEEEVDYWSEEIPSIYEKLLFGRWHNFIVSDEIEAFEAAYEEDQVRVKKLKYMLYDTSEYKAKFPDEVTLERWEKNKDEIKNNLNWLSQAKVEIHKDSPRYNEYFNNDWVVSRQIQGLIWYKEFLKKVIRDGSPCYFKLQQEENNLQVHRKSRNISMKELKRSNDGYEAFKASFGDFVRANDRSPKWSELMVYMTKHPPEGFIVEPIYERNKLIAITIEGVDKPIDREAFSKRFNRYCKKTDIKPDNS